MNHWFTADDAPIVATHVKRFDPLHWAVDFPRGTVASLVTSADAHGIELTAEVLRKGDLIGLIWESEDRHSHAAHRRETARDYSRCALSFRWRSTSAMPLDAVNGPTLTIEGKDADGAERAWYVRLWNYAQGSPTDAVVTMDFDKISGGFGLPADADTVDPRSIDRMFISIVPPDYVEGSSDLRAVPAKVGVTISDIRCDGSGSVIDLRDAVVPEHELRIATAYDDLYHLPAERVIDAVERLGFRRIINHYVGMSHFFALDGVGKVDPSRPFNDAALAWHLEFAREAKARDYDVIWSVSYEILDMFCPDAWKQRAFDGSPALTGWSPPSVLLSPANDEAIGFLERVAEALVEVARDVGLKPMVQIGEPWWWVTPSGGICLYDEAAKVALGGSPVEIGDVHAPMTSAQLALLDRAGELLAASTARIAAAVKAAASDATTLLLTYLPTTLDPKAPEARRANLPLGWAKPAFDVLQIEDYDWVSAGQDGRRVTARAEVEERLGYPSAEQHYLSGFVLDPAQRGDWARIIDAAVEAKRTGVAESFIWALPQVLRDNLTLFGEEPELVPFDDVLFPIEIGAEASVSPSFSTNVLTSASGYEWRNVNWQQARLRFDAGPGVRGDDELETLIAFFRARRGPAVGFRFRDPYDFSSSVMTAIPAATDQGIGTADGTTVRFELTKGYGDGERRRITRPVAGSVRVAVSGIEKATGWSVIEPGVVLFDDPPPLGALVTAGFLFDVPVRFAEDRIEVNRATFLAGEAPSVPLVEVREA
jgi:uncharacterized protein (TIGR02217 family)